MIKKSCPYCESVQDVKEIRQNEIIEYKGKMVSYDAIHYECCHCHDIFDSTEMMNANLSSVKDAFDLQYNSISANEIIKIREKYNASQKAFSLILGMGELTINSYEQEKSIPNSTNKLLIKLAENPLIFFEMYEQKYGTTIRKMNPESCEINDLLTCHQFDSLERRWTVDDWI